MKKYIKLLIGLLGVTSFMFSSCTKDALNQKSDIRLTVASTVNDYQQLLDGLGSYNTILPLYGSLGSYMSDDVYLSNDSYNSFNANNQQVVQKIYTWDKHLFSSVTSLLEWDDQYRIVLNTNIVLSGLAGIPVTASNKAAWNNTEGSAYMIRGLMFLTLAQYWAQPYNQNSSSSDLGIVLRLSDNINEKSVRSSVAGTYAQIISDLKTAVKYLPNSSTANTKVVKVRPSKAAAYGYLAKTFLAMQDYQDVYLYADSALQLYSSLLDYNAVASSGGFQNYNAEIVFDGGDGGGTGQYSFNYDIDSTLVNSFNSNDLRSTLFFFNDNGEYKWSGDYTQYQAFTGLAVDELYLMRAEASARLGNADKAMADLNTLLVTRWTTGTYVPMAASSADDALNKILVERRKELILRGTRWADLRRLNTDTRFSKTLTRVINGQTYTLPPNDSRYTLQIPPYIISINGIQQNP